MKFPVRYQALRPLGAGGAGSVWAVKDRVTGERLALKLVHQEASSSELDALVREASALAALSQAGLPEVRAIGVIPGTNRRYLVRALVDGDSLENVLDGSAPWFEALVMACDQLALLHRAGSLHGDIKPANVMVTKDGGGCLVDLGLSAPLLIGGTRTLGLTPRFAAPELLEGERLTVRAEVFSVGATLRDAIARRGDELGAELRMGLTKLVHRATSLAPATRHPSIDEFLAEMAAIPGASLPTRTRALVWRVSGISETVRSLQVLAQELQPGAAVVLHGPAESGRSTLLRELAWSMAAAGDEVVHISGEVTDKALAIYAEELAERPDARLLVDDFDLLPEPIQQRICTLSGEPSRMVLVTRSEAPRPFVEHGRVAIPTLHASVLETLVRGAIPSVSRTAVLAMLDHAEGRPGALRRLVARCAGKAMVGRDDVERAKFGDEKMNAERAEWPQRLASALYSGHFATARVALEALEASGEHEHVFARALGEVRVRIAQGDNEHAGQWLERAANAARGPTEQAEVFLYRARLMLRRGDYDAIGAVLVEAEARAEASSELRIVAALAQAMSRPTQENVAVLAEIYGHMPAEAGRREQAIAAVSLAIAEQRSGSTAAARRHYAEALTHAEDAGDGWALCTTYVNCAALAHNVGESAEAIRMLEAAIDLAERLGADLAAYTATLNLVALNLQIGRYERATEGIRWLEEYVLSPYASAQLCGLRGELCERGQLLEPAARFYADSAEQFFAMGMHTDACEAELMLLACDAGRTDVNEVELAARWQAFSEKYRNESESELASQWAYAEACVLRRLHGAHEGAKAFGRAADSARQAEQKEVLWQALLGQARAHREHGAPALAGRAATEAVEVLEAIAAPLPQDLCEVFWSDPRRAELRAMVSLPARTSAVSVGAPTVGLAGATAMQHLVQSARALVRVHDPGKVLADTLEHAVAIVGGAKGMLHYRDVLGRAEWVAPYSFEADAFTSVRKLLEQCTESGEVILSSGDQLATLCIPIPRSPMQAGLSTTMGGLTQGAVYVQTTNAGRTKLEEHLGALSALVAHAAAVLETARLVARLKRQKERVSELLEKRSRSLHSTRAELRNVRSELKESQSFGGMVGSSKPMQLLFEGIRRVATSDVPVLVRGESGTGKELVARAVHEHSERKRSPFLAINCAAVPASMLEGELFGYRKGAFSGAVRDHEGLLLAARDGTFFLDEVGEMPMQMQAAMLRVLQERVVRPLGSSEELPIRARIVAATHRDLAAMVQEGTFREDLYYRLEVVTLNIPPLRERREDIVLLADSFLRRAAVAHRQPRKTLARSAREALMQAPWPGNVRQLEHALTSAVLFSDGDTLHANDLALLRPPSEGSTRGAAPSGQSHRPAAPLADKDRFLQALAEAGGNRLRAANALGIPRRTFYRRLAELEIGSKVPQKS